MKKGGKARSPYRSVDDVKEWLVAFAPLANDDPVFAAALSIWRVYEARLRQLAAPWGRLDGSRTDYLLKTHPIKSWAIMRGQEQALAAVTAHSDADRMRLLAQAVCTLNGFWLSDLHQAASANRRNASKTRKRPSQEEFSDFVVAVGYPDRVEGDDFITLVTEEFDCGDSTARRRLSAWLTEHPSKKRYMS